MTLAQSMLPEFDHEMATTRQVLERIPEADAAWKPHPRSTALGSLAVHLATLVSRTVPVVTQSELDLMPGGSRYTEPDFTTTAELVRVFDQNVRTAREHLAAAEDAGMKERWTLKAAGREIFSLPRKAALRTFIMNHMIHHRAQLTVYLRLRDVPLPSIYGPTADTKVAP